MEQKIELEILYDRNIKGLSYRTLARKYGISRTQIHRMVMSKQKKREKPKVIKPVVEEELALPDDIKTLKEELRLARLKIELQDLMIDISSKELGIDLRKKHGTRRSK
jgi:transposase